MTTRKSKTLKDAEDRLIAQANFFDEVHQFLNSIERGICQYTSVYRAENVIRDGFSKIRDGLYEEQSHVQSRLLAIVGIGGEKAKEFSIEHAKRLFDRESEIMQWTTKNFELPGIWSQAAEDLLQEEVLAALKEVEDAKTS